MPVTVHDIPRKDLDDRPWLRRLLVACILLLVIGAIAFGAWRMGIYGNRRGEEKLQQSKARISINFTNIPSWLMPTPQEAKKNPYSIVVESMDNPDSIMNDVIAFTRETVTYGTAEKPAVTNYARLQNPEDQSVLRDLAGYLQSIGDLHGRSPDSLDRAWIKSVRSIKRESVRDATGTDIEHVIIDAEYRQPVAFVVQGDSYYLVENVSVSAGEKQVVRLPGVYPFSYRRLRSDLPCISGIDSPTPRPGEAFKTPDVIAGVELAAVLAKQPYVRQIAAINMTNFNGRRDNNPETLKPFITLDTIFANTAEPGEPTRVYWGRPIDEEQFYEVRSPTKLHFLTTLFMKYNRIDAAAPYVDLRFDQPQIPMPAKPHSDATPLASADSARHG